MTWRVSPQVRPARMDHSPSFWEPDPDAHEVSKNPDEELSGTTRIGGTSTDGSEHSPRHGNGLSPAEEAFPLHSISFREWQARLSSCGYNSSYPSEEETFPISSYTISDGELAVPESSRHVSFVASPRHSVHRSELSVQPYSEVYGAHPKKFDFDARGNQVTKSTAAGKQAAWVWDPDVPGGSRRVARSSRWWFFRSSED